MQIGYSKKITEIILDDFFDIILEKLISNNKVNITNFGTFTLKKKPQRLGRNPKTKEAAVIVERNVITFKSSKELKNFINNEQ